MNLNMVEAINLALKQEMKKDKTVILLGEDIGKDGGVFRVTEGLLDIYGENRVIDTPLAESGIVGCSIGMAINGLKPVCEIQFEGFIFPAIDQIISHASRLRNRSRGRYTVPLVVRSPIGGGIKALEHHSESPESHYMHIPGIKVVVPSRPYNAKGLLISAIRDPDPVIFFEPKKIYRAFKEEVPEEEYTIPLGKAEILKEGEDVTLIGFGAWIKNCLEAAEELKNEISVEVLDLQTLSPLDVDAIIDSVKKTGRAVVVQEAQKTCGIASEITSLINEKAFLNMEAPVEVLAGVDTITPMPKLEDYYFPNTKKIVKLVRKVNSF